MGQATCAWATSMHLALRRCPSHLRLCFPHSSARLQGHPGTGMALVAPGRQGPWQPPLWRHQQWTLASHTLSAGVYGVGTWGLGYLYPDLEGWGYSEPPTWHPGRKHLLDSRKVEPARGATAQDNSLWELHCSVPAKPWGWGLPKLLGLEGRASIQK